MDGSGFTLRWGDDTRTVENGSNVVTEEVICELEGQAQHFSNMSHETINSDADHAIAAENLMFLAHDMIGHIGYVDAVGNTEEVQQQPEDEIECQVTEEVITDDWVEPGGQERIEVPMEHLVVSAVEMNNEENDIDVPLPTDQDQYTAMRPWPCDFCSRRFRKKAALVNHMVAHQNDRPYGCNLCGIRYVRRADLMNHLKIHAYVPEDPDDVTNEFDDYIDVQESKPIISPRKRKGGRRKKHRSSEENGRNSFSYAEEEPQGSARTQQYSRSALSSNVQAAILPPPRPQLLPSDPRKPFVCQHCGVGFAREKALASHSRIHGGDSPLECSVCGELCWSRDALAHHIRHRHPHLPAMMLSPNNDDSIESDYSAADSAGDEEESGRSRGGYTRGPELFCQHCGAAFQRADLLRRHTLAAHSYKQEPIDPPSPTEEDAAWGDMHNCGVCGEGFRDALDLLAHAESHARTNMYRCWRCGSVDPSHSCSVDDVTGEDGIDDDLSDDVSNIVTISSSSAALDCTYCGKIFRSRARLKRHIALHRSRGTTSMSCATCGQKFSDSRSLAAHRIAHHPQHHNSGNKQFPCKECGKTFGSRSSQQIHIRIHTGERPYGCRFCWKAFADGGTLRKHERIHTGEKPYACAVCPRAFNQRVVLREHVRSHHGGAEACAVCGRRFPAGADLVRHLVQHCDANTALNRRPQVGPRKYKRRRKLKTLESEAGAEAEADGEAEAGGGEAEAGRRPRRGRRPSRPPAPPAPPASPPAPPSPDDRPAASAPAPRNKRRRGGPSAEAEAAPSRAKMIHTRRAEGAGGAGRRAAERPAPRAPRRRPPADPAADLRAIAEGPFRCEMCSLSFPSRDRLLLHVPVHI